MTYEYLEKEDIYLIFAALPEGVEGFCKEVNSYRYVVISESLDEDEKKKAIEHELNHLRNNDLYREFEELEVI